MDSVPPLADRIRSSMLPGITRIQPFALFPLSIIFLFASHFPLCAQDQAAVDFEKDVLPILELHCFECHGSSKQTMDLRLDLRSGIVKGSSNGPVIVAGASAKSRLIEVVDGSDPDTAMPPQGAPLNPKEISILRGWIDQGALGPDDSDRLNRPTPWSFRPITGGPLPKPFLMDSASGPIDAWLTHRLATDQLEFSSRADRRTLIRRLFLVALGVPPTPDESESFVADTSIDAYERLVDGVLADPRYGERFARHWFDVIRFAESNGFETNRVRYNAWPYRDYVIAAFNQDKPYNEFISEQIAGDAIGVDLGTGFLVAGTYDIVKSPDVNLTLMQRQDELADLINTTGTAFLGLTLGCARCHDHKFDPITQKDFYSLQAIYAGVQFGDRTVVSSQPVESQSRLKALVKELDEIERELRVLRDRAQAIAAEKQLRVAVNPKLNEENFPPIQTQSVRFRILASGGSQPCIDEWEVYTEGGINIAAATRGTKPKASSTLPGYPIHQLAFINDEKTGNSNSWISNEVDSGFVQLDFEKPTTIVRMLWGRDRKEQYVDRIPHEYEIQALAQEGTWITIASHRDRIRSQTANTDAYADLLVPLDKARYNDLKSQQKNRLTERESLSMGPKVWLGTFSQPGPIHRLHRGDPLLKREVVPPALVESLQGPELDPDTPEQARRIALAQWLTHPGNPLVPRVIANRLWQFTFGTGIVDTPSDFGLNGSLPTHPELLDRLAKELIENGWSLKHLHRQMLTSHAFQQSSQPNPRGLASDADSRLLWRYPPRRLEAEAIRDSILSVTGVLDSRMGGPGFFLQRVEQDNVYRYFPKETVGPAEFRRMVYLTRIRQEQDPVFGAFDCPSGNQVIPKRARSNTPLQSLNLFNSPFVMQQSELLAGRLEREAGIAIDAKIHRAFELLFARPPDEQEQSLSKSMIDKEGLLPFCRALLNASEFLFVF